MIDNFTHSEQKFKEIHKDLLSSNTELHSEADSRLHLIDRILIEVLGWPRDAIQTERKSESGYSDYRITMNRRNLFIVEAKKDNLDLVDTVASYYKTLKLESSIFKNAKAGIEQAINYSKDESVPYASVTNGKTWIGFRSVRTDGVPTNEGMACVFTDLEAIEKDFSKFYELFSYEGVSQKLYNIYLDRAEGLPLSNTEPLFVVDSNVYMSKRSPLADDIEQVFNKFFQTITSDQDSELLSACFVETVESNKADQSLKKITRDVVNSIQSINTETGEQLQKAIKQSTSHAGEKQIILLVGNKGAGKSTFIDRFFKIVLEKSIRDKCLILKIDLSRATGNREKVLNWLTNELIKESEKDLYPDHTPSYDQLQGIFFKDYQEWSKGPYKHLYETNKDEFKTKFGDFLYKKKSDEPDEPDEYLHSLLNKVIQQRELVPCIILDNADNFPPDFQDIIFQYAHSLFQEISTSIVLLPITDRTIWRLNKAGALQSYPSKSFYLPIPAPREVIQKRVSFLKTKLAEGKQKSERYFSSKGIKIVIEQIESFAACVEETFIKTDYIARKISWLTNNEIRRSLEFTKKIITSPTLGVDDLLTAHLSKKSLTISPHKITKAILYGDYNRYSRENNEFIINLFENECQQVNSPLLRMSILRLLRDRENASTTDEMDSYIPFAEIENYFSPMGINTQTLILAVKQLIKSRLIDPYDPNLDNKHESGIEFITQDTKVSISLAARIHIEMAFGDIVYITEMARICPIRSESTVHQIRSILNKDDKYPWEQIASVFMSYCLQEDERLITIPNIIHYKSQREFREELRNEWIKKYNN